MIDEGAILGTHRARGWAMRRKSDGQLWQVGYQGLEFPLALNERPILGSSSPDHFEMVEVERVVTIVALHRTRPASWRPMGPDCGPHRADELCYGCATIEQITDRPSPRRGGEQGERLGTLSAKWRQQADGYRPSDVYHGSLMRIALRRCADELDAAQLGEHD